MTTAMDELAAHRSAIFGIAYRMLGSASEAEDVVQETLLRWARSAPDDLRAPRAWLRRTATRVCLDRLGSARARRETVGVALPEPVADVDAERTALLAESLGFAFLRMLQSMSPVERAVFLLHEVFELEHAEVAAAVGKTEAASRQILRRARQRLRDERPRFDAEESRVQALVERFAEVARGGDVDGLLALLAPDVVLHADGGEARYGRARAVGKPLEGAVVVARFLAAVQMQADGPVEARVAEVNGAPGLVVERAGAVVAVFAFRVYEGRVAEVFLVADPERLCHFTG
ncbi:MAG: sigma-70 family RNA polymerase sigma factor [Myxococcales bacterium]|nr:sigma-70 family RNA polymerase sigma factor [Myxococcales bacterium]